MSAPRAAAAGALALALAWPAAGARADQQAARIAGPEQVVFSYAQSRCGDSDFPDLPARAFRGAHGRVQLILSHYVNRRMIGRDLNHLTHPCAPIMASNGNDDPAAFDDRRWIASVYTLNGKTIFALVHEEYQGHLHPGHCPSGVYAMCWYNAVTFAVSTNGGKTYIQPRPPAQLVATIPNQYVPDHGPTGIFAPSNIVRKGAYYYALAQVIGPGGTPRGTCAMRTRSLAVPSAWRGWDGSGFTVQFADPYMGRRKSVPQYQCQPVSPAQISQMRESLTYNTFFHSFLLVGQSRATDTQTGQTVWGFYFSLSNDLVHWSQRQLLMEATTTTSYACGGPDPIAYPSIIDPNSRSRNFETSGKRVYLYFTRFNYANCRQTNDRDLIRVPIELSQ
ncbi:MAG TPA: hypothetical protein VIM23_08590 [Gaiellaceae bacterium]|jgi:hypothetical protein